MAICPMCGETIFYLKNYQSGEKVYTFDGKFYDDAPEEFIPDDRTNDYVCPLCEAQLFTDEKIVRNFFAKKEGK